MQYRYQTEAALLLTSAQSDCFKKISDTGIVAAILRRTDQWTNGIPFLDKIIYDYVGRYSSQIVKELGGAGLVDEIVICKIVRNWEENAAASHLKAVRQNILSSDDLSLLLILYFRILQQGAIKVRNFPEEKTIVQLKLATVDNKLLKPANAVYARVFNIDWIEEYLPGITRPIVDKRAVGNHVQSY